VIDAQGDNQCVFYGQMEQSPQPPNLAEILSMLIEKSKELDTSTVDTLQISQGKFLFGNFEQIFVILKILPSADVSLVGEFLNNLSQRFLEKYGDNLGSYDGDVSVFAEFGEIAANTYSEFQPKEEIMPETTMGEEEATPEEQSISGLPETGISGPSDDQAQESEEISLEENSASKELNASDYIRSAEPIRFTPQEIPRAKEGGPLIKPMKRNAYPDGLPEYSRDEILWNEAQAVMGEYAADFVDGIISKLQMSMSISLTHHYDLVVDFTNYPEMPTITIPKSLAEDIEQPLEEALYFMQNWDPKIPPHMIEIVRELEAFLVKKKGESKLTPTAEMPETAMPELTPLQPLPELTPEQKAQVAKYEADKRAQKLAEQELAEQAAAAENEPETAEAVVIPTKQLKEKEKKPAKKQKPKEEIKLEIPQIQVKATKGKSPAQGSPDWDKLNQKESEKIAVCTAKYNKAILDFLSPVGKKVFSIGRVTDYVKEFAEDRLKDENLNPQERTTLEKLVNDLKQSQKLPKGAMKEGMKEMKELRKEFSSGSRAPRPVVGHGLAGVMSSAKSNAEERLDLDKQVFEAMRPKFERELTPTDAYVLFTKRVLPIRDRGVIKFLIQDKKDGPDYGAFESRLKELKNTFIESYKAFHTLIGQILTNPEEAIHEAENRENVVKYIIEAGGLLAAGKEMPLPPDFNLGNISDLCDEIGDLPGKLIKSLALSDINPSTPSIEQVLKLYAGSI